MNKLEELKKLCARATPGPWEYHEINSKHRVYGRGGPQGQVQICDSVWGPGIHERRCTDLEFIAAASACMPKLIKIAEAAAQLCQGDRFELDVSHCVSYVTRQDLERLLEALEPFKESAGGTAIL